MRGARISAQGGDLPPDAERDGPFGFFVLFGGSVVATVLIVHAGR
jgi:hypothetical protein